MVTNERQARELYTNGKKEKGMKKWQLTGPVLKRGMDPWMLAATMAQLPKGQL